LELEEEAPAGFSWTQRFTWQSIYSRSSCHGELEGGLWGVVSVPDSAVQSSKLPAYFSEKRERGGRVKPEADTYLIGGQHLSHCQVLGIHVHIRSEAQEGGHGADIVLFSAVVHQVDRPREGLGRGIEGREAGGDATIGGEWDPGAGAEAEHLYIPVDAIKSIREAQKSATR
jgi:hypothetical protein